MARKKTKKQKTKSKVLSVSSVSKIKATTFSESQVSLLHKDLLKTLITSVVVFGILIFYIFK